MKTIYRAVLLAILLLSQGSEATELKSDSRMADLDIENRPSQTCGDAEGQAVRSLLELFETDNFKEFLAKRSLPMPRIVNYVVPSEVDPIVKTVSA